MRVNGILAILSFCLLAACSGKAPKLGIENGQLLPCPDKPNCVASLGKNADQKVEPIILFLSLQETRSHLKQAMEQIGGNVVKENDQYLRAEFTSRIFGFVDDLECYLIPGIEQTKIHVRSASRFGYSDLGVNRERVEKLRDIIKQ